MYGIDSGQISPEVDKNYVHKNTSLKRPVYEPQPEINLYDKSNGQQQRLQKSLNMVNMKIINNPDENISDRR